MEEQRKARTRMMTVIALIVLAAVIAFAVIYYLNREQNAPAAQPVKPATELGEYWTEGSEAAQSLRDYVAKVTDPKDTANFIPEKDRIAVFDMDGTLVCETYYTYFDTMMFIEYCLNDHPERVSDELKQAAAEIKPGYTAGEELARNFAKAFAGMTMEEFHDYIIEFGAVVMRRGTVVEEKDFFIKPKIDLSLNIKNLTHITEENLKDARPFEECKDEILDFIKGRVLVAHNASFDFGFLNSEFERIGMPKLTNPVIDTLDLSRSLLKNRRAYRLGNMCRAYNIPYDEDVAHRANYDADVLAQVFNFMLKDLAKAGVNTLNDLKNFQDEEAFVKNRAFHTTVLCKNKAGLKDLFKLISISNTKTLAVFGKANTKDTSSELIAEPRIFKETIEEYRENLLIGSACLNGEVF